jgi:hypothetical protein
VDDFEAFKKKKQAAEKAEQEATKQEAEFDEAAKKMGWVDGLGFVGHQNPKVKGFILGRAKKKKVDPKGLERPKGMETHRHDIVPPGAEKPAEKKVEPAPKPKNIQRY